MQALFLATLLFAAEPDSIRPLGADGKPLNLDFETGTLEHWTADGEAFKDQPVKGDTVGARRKDMKSGHTGDYWIGSYEKHGDKPTGTLTSNAFAVTHPWATFLIGGGSGAETRVEIVHDGKVIFKAHGADNEKMARVAVDLAKYQGKLIQIRIVDHATGGWGHVNFDDFRFHTGEPKGIAKQASPLSADELKYAGLPPEKAAAAMTVPEGFSVSLFAGEPDVHQPIAFCFDDRGRLWVVEAYTYPTRNKHHGPVLPEAEKAKGDKVLILEDTDGDGKFDKKTVFMEGLNLVSGIEYGFGGIYIGAAPFLLHIPIKDDKPAGEPVILLDGWGYQDTHETLNSFVWGPDGWLYGCHGVFTHSKVGKPGTADKDRVKIDAGVWRYHPTRHVFERFAEGTSNPWGLDYNQYGDFFCEACVIPHLFHIVQGGRYTRQAGQHFNPHTYIEIPTIADHLHYLGANPHGGNNKSASAGGGHAHCGLMCYQGGAWPKEYHGQLFMGNIHGRRINMDIPVPKGSSYVGQHGKDFLLANDAWARFIALKYGPDGNVFVIDWYDAQACHRKEPEVWDRTNGRIYKISYRGTKPVTNLDLAKCSDEELVKYQTHENEWYAAHARRILMERNEALASNTKSLIVKMARTNPDPTIRLRAIWTLSCILTYKKPPYSIEPASYSLSDKEPFIRAWGFTLLEQYHAILTTAAPKEQNDIIWGHYLDMAKKHLSKQNGLLSEQEQLRFYSALQRLPYDKHPSFLRDIGMKHAASGDGNTTLNAVKWYGLESIADKSPDIILSLAEKDPFLARLVVRRLTATGKKENLNLIVAKLNTITAYEEQLAFLLAILEGLANTPSSYTPPQWNAVYQKLSTSMSTDVRSACLRVAVAFRDSNAMDALRTKMLDKNLNRQERLSAFQALYEVKDVKLAATFPAGINDEILRPMIIRAMTTFGGTDAPVIILKSYSQFNATEKRDAVATLASKPAFAMALLDAIEAKTIPASDVPAETIRQLRSFNDAKLNAKVVAVWGTLRDTPADRKKFIAEWRSKLTLSHDPDLAEGRAVFAKTCQQCHTLYGVGASVGPDITGSNRADLNYLLENIFDPSAVIQKEYTATTFDMADGRKITGIVKSETAAVITVATATETLRLNVADIEKRKPSEMSMMPDDLTKPLSDREVKNLIAYLRHPQQTPMKATPENAKDFFNGKDLTGWDGDKDVWSVENGEIVGKSAKGLKVNQFITSNLEVSDFKLSLKVKLVPDKENSGIQFRSVRIEGTEMRGPQADIGKGWWGKLYEESGRGILVKDGGEKHVKPDDWNDYVVEAKGSTVKIWINGNEVCNYTDEKLAKKGLIGLQAHAGGPIEVRWKDLKLEVLK